MEFIGNNLQFKTRTIRQKDVDDVSVFVVQIETEANPERAQELSKLLNMSLNIDVEGAQVDAFKK